MIIRPNLAGRAVQSAVRMRGEALVSVFCRENMLPKLPMYISSYNSSGEIPVQAKMNNPKRASEEAMAPKVIARV